MKLKLRIFSLSCVLILMFSFTSCHSHRNTVRGHKGEIPIELQGNPSKDSGKRGAPAKVIAEGKRWLGTPYRYGGLSRNGIDCSGLVQVVFDKSVGVKLPHNSRDQAMKARKVSRKDLRPADLVFFVSSPGGNRINHVAIYIGDGKIIHSTTSRGVIVSGLDENYWKKHFYCCGRVL